MIDAKKIVAMAENLGAESSDVIISKTDTSGSFIERNIVTNVLSGVSEGYGIRVISNRRIGFVSGNDFSKSAVEKAIKMAISISKRGKKVPRGFEFSSSNKKTDVKKTFDKKISEASEDDVVSFSNDFIKNMGDANIPLARIRFMKTEYNISNSSGADISDKGTFLVLYANTLKKSGEKMIEYEILEKTRMLDMMNLDRICSEARMHIKKSMNTKAVKTQKIPVIFSPKVLTELLITTFGEALCSKSVLLKNSPFSDKINKKIASEKFSLTDDGTLDAGLSTFGVDHEGVRTKKTVLINKGILKNFLYDAIDAARAGKKSTGNGRRGSWIYDDLFYLEPSAQASNLVVAPGTIGIDEIIKDTRKGLFVDKVSWPRGSACSGMFSLELRTAYMIENGELTKPVRWGSVIGSIYDAINEIEIGKEVESRAPYPTGFIESVVTPHIKFEQLDVVSKNRLQCNVS